MREFIVTIKDAVRTIREDLDAEVDGDAADQMSMSIPLRKLESERELNKMSDRLASIQQAMNREDTPADQYSRLDLEYEESVRLIMTTKKEFEKWCLQEKIINRRTLKIIQILCQLTVKNGLTDDDMMWAVNFIIEHIKSKDYENMDIALS